MNPPATPMYHQIYLVLREQIAEGQFEKGKLPSEVSLAEQFRVSRITMRKALDRLVVEGVITRRRGSGSFVSTPPVQPKKKLRVGGLLEDIISLGLASKAKVLDMKMVTAPLEVADLLEVARGELVLKVTRVRSYLGQKLSHITTYLPQEIAHYLKRANLESKPMLSLLEQAGVQEHPIGVSVGERGPSDPGRRTSTDRDAALDPTRQSKRVSALLRRGVSAG